MMCRTIGHSVICTFKLLKFGKVTIQNLAFCNLTFGKKNVALKFTPGGQLRFWCQSLPLGVKLRTGLRMTVFKACLHEHWKLVLRCAVQDRAPQVRINPNLCSMASCDVARQEFIVRVNRPLVRQQLPFKLQVRQQQVQHVNKVWELQVGHLLEVRKRQDWHVHELT
jgi:hypothetical protein